MTRFYRLFVIAMAGVLGLSISACKELESYPEKPEPVVEKTEPLVATVTAVIPQKTKVDEPVITPAQMASAIKQALTQGVDDSVYLLGSLEGFSLSNQYRIRIPDELETPAALMRTLGQGKKVDEFEQRLNRAAKLAVKQASPVFYRAIDAMSITDVVSIMQGEDDAATQYFRKITEQDLRRQFTPIIREATGKTGLTKAYKQLNNTIITLMDDNYRYTVDIDDYVLDHSMNALFDRIALEEKLIREQPVKRTTELMKTVYGYFASY